MECPHCGHSNRHGAKFCSHCGQSLPEVCPSCGADADAGANFCDMCGTSLDSAPPPRAPKPVPTPTIVLPEAPSAERRQLTVVFCDIVGSTELSGRLDPEALRDVIRAYQTAAEKVILRYEGHIAQYLGDGLLVYFGYPHAHEDDVHRATRAALGILGAMSLLAPEIHDRWGVDLEVRIGAHTGHVVVGDMGGDEVRESLAVGDTPNIAARVQGAAEPGSLVLSDASYRIVQGFFDCAPLGAHALRGVTAPVDLYRVLHESAAKTRLDVAATLGLTPLVGRDREVAMLRERWEDVKRGAGHVISLRGEGGIGKSRLLSSIKEHVALDADAWLTESQCSAHHRNTALHPVIDLFENTVLGLTRDDTAASKRDKLTGLLAQYGFELGEAVPLFGELFGISPEDGLASSDLSPAQRKQRVLEGFVRMLSIRAGQQPVLFVMEDLQWADPSTLELVSMMMDQVPTVPFLMVLTSRPEFEPPWGQRSYATHVSLTRLPPDATLDMVTRITRGKALPREVLDQVVAKTDGVPLFIEELLKTVLDSDMVEETAGRYELTRPLPALGIPSTLHASLMARLDRLAAVRDVLQLAATVGREFSYELLRAVSPLDEATLRAHLAELVGAEFLYPRGAPPTATYTFKHALVQDAAYGSLLRSTQQQYHHKIAEALRSNAPGDGEAEPELLAHHYTEAGRPQEAVEYWHRAGARANERAATLEAISHLTKALDLLEALPTSEENEGREFDTLTELGPALIASRGYARPEVKETYTRALELSRQLGEDSPEQFRALAGLWNYYMSRGPLQTARQIAEQLLETAERLDDRSLQLSARAMLADVMYNSGAFVAAVEHGETGIALDDEERAAGVESRTDDGIMCRVWASWALERMGHGERARAMADEALKLGSAHPSALVRTEAAAYASGFVRSTREFAAAREHCDRQAALAEEYGFPTFRAIADVHMGWIAAWHGDPAGVAQAQSG
ncbi:AAA family ATPase, partial [Candidatus Poribacteria bacterium]|nr:AAA family ATPase [Candidatus Poribacteria bacterium]